MNRKRKIKKRLIDDKILCVAMKAGLIILVRSMIQPQMDVRMMRQQRVKRDLWRNAQSEQRQHKASQ